MRTFRVGQTIHEEAEPSTATKAKVVFVRGTATVDGRHASAGHFAADLFGGHYKGGTLRPPTIWEGVLLTNS